uniref:Kazal-like domain-containing protein n=1 Tax=Periophthalmus magnuspinnatus TaxID=409849 RepID=A0A3B4B7L6_9GOBI
MKVRVMTLLTSLRSERVRALLTHMTLYFSVVSRAVTVSFLNCFVVFSRYSFMFIMLTCNPAPPCSPCPVGSLVVPAGGGGTFLGGYIVQRCDLRCRGIIRFCAVCCSLSLLSAFVFFVHCPDVSMAGVTAPYGIHSSLDERLLAQCNSNCSCDRLFSPVCGADHRMYFSPCYAGCTSINLTSEGQVYSNCSCVAANSSHERLALAGRCSTACPYMPLFLTVFFFCILFTFLTSIPWILVRTLGETLIIIPLFHLMSRAIPGPIIFGSMVDRSCLLWQDKCGEQGSCFVYKNTDMSRFTLIAGIIYKVNLDTFFIFIFFFYYFHDYSNCRFSLKASNL